MHTKGKKAGASEQQKAPVHVARHQHSEYLGIFFMQTLFLQFYGTVQ